MADTLPPLRVRDASGTPNFIPAFEVVFSGATLTRLSPISVQVRIDSGGAGSSVVYAPTGAFYAMVAASNPPLSNAKLITAGSSVTISTDSTAIYFTAITNSPVAGISIGLGYALASGNLLFGS